MSENHAKTNVKTDDNTKGSDYLPGKVSTDSKAENQKGKSTLCDKETHDDKCCNQSKACDLKKDGKAQQGDIPKDYDFPKEDQTNGEQGNYHGTGKDNRAHKDTVEDKNNSAEVKDPKNVVVGDKSHGLDQKQANDPKDVDDANIKNTTK